MATLLELSGEGRLYRLDILDGGRQEFRCFYTSEKLKAWLVNDLPLLQATWQTELSCQEQVIDLIENFCAGDPLNFGEQFHVLKPISNGVWELKTGDVRIFGWFQSKDHFVGVVASETFRVKLHQLYAGYVGEVMRFRNALPLDEPKFIAGDDPYAVLSNFD